MDKRIADYQELLRQVTDQRACEVLNKLIAECVAAKVSFHSVPDTKVSRGDR
jgi:hypothetical protein